MRILVFAYACEPSRGSEPAVGWMWSHLLSGLGDVHVITRANNRAAIEAADTSERIHFTYVDLPPWARFWKRGRRGIHLYYVLWQWAALKEARRIVHQHPIDLVWHLTIANVWMGSVAPLVGPPAVFGPVGGGVSPPLQLMTTLGVRGLIQEIIRVLVRGLARYMNPLGRAAWRRSDLILVQNRETKRWLPKKHRDKTAIVPNPLADLAPPVTSEVAEPRLPTTALYAGELIPLKGVALAIRAIARLSGWRLIICGKGWDEARLRRLTDRYGIQDRVEFRGWIGQQDLMNLMKRVSVLLFPSLHDEGGFVVVEALSLGLPVVCLDRGGPRELGGTAVRSRSPGATSRALAETVQLAAGSDPPAPPDARLRRRQLAALLEEHGLVPTDTARKFGEA